MDDLKQLDATENQDEFNSLLLRRLRGDPSLGPTPIVHQDEEYQDGLYACYRSEGWDDQRRAWFLHALREAISTFWQKAESKPLSRAVDLARRIAPPGDAGEWDCFPKYLDWGQDRHSLSLSALTLLYAWNLRDGNFWRETLDDAVTAKPWLGRTALLALQGLAHHEPLADKGLWERLIRAWAQDDPLHPSLLKSALLVGWQTSKAHSGDIPAYSEIGWIDALKFAITSLRAAQPLASFPRAAPILIDNLRFLLKRPWTSPEEPRQVLDEAVVALQDALKAATETKTPAVRYRKAHQNASPYRNAA